MTTPDLPDPSALPTAADPVPAPADAPPAPSDSAPLRLLLSGKTIATGRLDRLGDHPAFLVESLAQ